MGMGKTARRIRRLTSNQTIPAENQLYQHTTRLKCAGAKRKERILPFVDKTRITNANKNNYMPAGLRGRAKVRR